MTRDTAPATLVSAGIDQLREQNPYKEGRVSPARLFSDDDVRVMHLALAEDAGLPDHSAPVPILVQVIEGRVRFDVEGESHELGVGGMVHVAASVTHAVAPVGGAARILITLLAPGGHHHPKA
ncbi:hypothetical protein [Nocardiopsis algeriensis]|uniref:Quercetin dioxygenase-like cupin family protein n=1 Tax=Nocardiopsis algeriensis TaxID=1478215 RepID=A0A841IT87_9ACTN|nr:hypothetical protein [Nocardiopsis algeriensis]MBB6119398.1 quercetin dioxygenase-like cupin family protein [Nocardiopsis algeriensis]